jgi:hypothetical protein
MKNIIVLFFLLSFVGHSQTLEYSISSKDHPIGKLVVTKTEKNDVLQIEVTGEFKVHVLVSIDVKYKLNCTYKNQELIYSSVTTYSNGKVHSTSTTDKTGDYYTVTKDGHSSKYIDKITFSGALLYFKEPKGVSSVYSEFDDIDKSINKIGENEYQISNPNNGDFSKSTYKNGVLETSTVHSKFLTFTATKK